MLPLDSPRWAELEHTYGSAGDIPELLLQLEAAPSDFVADWTGPWNELWEALCHGGIEINTASYAAVPHFRRIARNARLDVTWGYLTFLTTVEVLRLRGEGPPVPEYLDASYFETIVTIPDWVNELSKSQWDHLLASSALAALTASKGQADLAWILTETSEDHIKPMIAFLEDREE